MRATVRCTHCPDLSPQEVEAPSLKELGPLVTSLLIAWHAGPPHCPHPLEVAFEGQEAAPEKELILKCIRDGAEVRTTVPIELVGAMTIVFHTAHEGHAMELTYGDRTWRSPG